MDTLISHKTLQAIRINAVQLRLLRQGAGYALSEAARMLGIKSRQQLWNYENALCDTPADVLARMCVLYKCQIEDLTGNDCA